jgi:hypothetical protein
MLSNTTSRKLTAFFVLALFEVFPFLRGETFERNAGNDLEVTFSVEPTLNADADWSLTYGRRNNQVDEYNSGVTNVVLFFEDGRDPVRHALPEGANRPEDVLDEPGVQWVLTRSEYRSDLVDPGEVTPTIHYTLYGGVEAALEAIVATAQRDAEAMRNALQPE